MFVIDPQGLEAGWYVAEAIQCLQEIKYILFTYLLAITRLLSRQQLFPKAKPREIIATEGDNKFANGLIASKIPLFIGDGEFVADNQIRVLT